MNERRDPAGLRVRADRLDRIDHESVAALASLGADCVLLVDAAGVIRKVVHGHGGMSEDALSAMEGRKLRDTVTVESVDKIDVMLSAGDGKLPTRDYQVNHPAGEAPDLPMRYRAYRQDGFPYTLVIGQSLRPVMDLQQRLVRAQIEMEADYRSLQENETRYRTAFQTSPTAQLLVSGDKRTILDANPAAKTMLGDAVNSLAGRTMRDLFDKADRDRITDALIETRHSGHGIAVDSVTALTGERMGLQLRAFRENGQTNLAVTLHPADGAGGTGDGGNRLGGRELSLALVPDPAILTDRRGRVINANDLFLDLLHAPNLRDASGRSVSQWFMGSAIDIDVLYSRLGEERVVRGFSAILTDNLGVERPVLISGRLDRDHDEVLLVVTRSGTESARLPLPGTALAYEPSGFTSLVGKIPMKDLIRESVDVIEKICIEAALQKTNNNRASAAELLGLSRQSLYIKLRRYGLEEFDPQDEA